MAEQSGSDKYIKCSRCKCKYINDYDNIKTNFGYNRLNLRFKTCVKCRTKTVKVKDDKEQTPIITVKDDKEQKHIITVKDDKEQTPIITVKDDTEQTPIINLKDDKEQTRILTVKADKDAFELLCQTLGITCKNIKREIMFDVNYLIIRYGNDGYGDKPESMNRVTYWAQHPDLTNYLT